MRSFQRYWIQGKVDSEWILPSSANTNLPIIYTNFYSYFKTGFLTTQRNGRPLGCAYMLVNSSYDSFNFIPRESFFFLFYREQKKLVDLTSTADRQLKSRQNFHLNILHKFCLEILWLTNEIIFLRAINNQMAWWYLFNRR